MADQLWHATPGEGASPESTNGDGGWTPKLEAPVASKGTGPSLLSQL